MAGRRGPSLTRESDFGRESGGTLVGQRGDRSGTCAVRVWATEGTKGERQGTEEGKWGDQSAAPPVSGEEGGKVDHDSPLAVSSAQAQGAVGARDGEQGWA